MVGIMSTRTHTHTGVGVGAELVTGANSDMSGANDWDGTTLDSLTIAGGKMTMVGDGGSDYAELPALTLELPVGTYWLSLKAKNAGAATEIFYGVTGTGSASDISFTPTGTEATYSGYITVGLAANLVVGKVVGGFNGITFEIDDVLVKQIYP